MTDDQRTERIDSKALQRFSCDVFQAAGLEETHSHRLAKALIRASLRGVDTHGIVRVGQYASKISEGGFNPSPDITIEERHGSMILLDADNAPGPCVGYQAIDHAVTTARETGVGIVSVKNSNHLGMAACYPLFAADRDCIGITMSHSGPRVAPFGGIDPFLGTNPIAYSIPTNHDFSVTLDMSTAVVANSKIRHAKEDGKSIPSDWAIDPDGNPTTDPSKVYALRPFGGAKGYGLGIFVDVLSGVLSGMNFAPNVDRLPEDDEKPMKLGHFIMAINIDCFSDAGRFKADMSTFIDRIKSVQPNDRFDEVRLPGERAAQTEKHRTRKGIPVSEGTVQELERQGKIYDISFPD